MQSPSHIVERNVRTIIEKMRSLHLRFGLLLQLWPVILTATINMLNTTPTSVAPLSSYYATFGEKPHILKLHPFGCRAFWLNSDHDRLTSKAKESTCVGTEYIGGYLILNTETGRTIV